MLPSLLVCESSSLSSSSFFDAEEEEGDDDDDDDDDLPPIMKRADGHSFLSEPWALAAPPSFAPLDQESAGSDSEEEEEEYNGDGDGGYGEAPSWPLSSASELHLPSSPSPRKYHQERKEIKGGGGGGGEEAYNGDNDEEEVIIMTMIHFFCRPFLHQMRRQPRLRRCRSIVSVI